MWNGWRWKWVENVRDLQHFVGQSPWKKEPAVIIHQGLIAETLSEADGVALIDESGNVKQGQSSVGWRPNTVVRLAKWPIPKWGGCRLCQSQGVYAGG